MANQDYSAVLARRRGVRLVRSRHSVHASEVAGVAGRRWQRQETALAIVVTIVLAIALLLLLDQAFDVLPNDTYGCRFCNDVEDVAPGS